MPRGLSHPIWLLFVKHACLFQRLLRGSADAQTSADQCVHVSLGQPQELASGNSESLIGFH